MIAETIPELKRLTLEEKLILIGELWEELATHPNAFPVREDHVTAVFKMVEQVIDWR